MFFPQSRTLSGVQWILSIITLKIQIKIIFRQGLTNLFCIKLYKIDRFNLQFPYIGKFFY